MYQIQDQYRQIEHENPDQMEMNRARNLIGVLAITIASIVALDYIPTAQVDVPEGMYSARNQLEKKIEVQHDG